MMSSLVIAIVLLAAPGESVSQVDQARPNSEPRPYHEISEDITDLIRREATAKNDSARIAAIEEMSVLYRELKRDPRLAEAPTIQRYKIKLWSRLSKIKNDLKREIARDQKRSALRRDEPTVDPQQDAYEEAGQSLATQMALASYSLGGPAQILARTGGGFGGGAVRDYGERLVELIERTIAPELWDTNGGPGAIFYYEPLRVLVVRATTEVHHKLGGGLRGLRDAGR